MPRSAASRTRRATTPGEACVNHAHASYLADKPAGAADAGGAQPAQHDHDLLPGARDRSLRNRAAALVGRDVVVRHGRSGRALVRCAVDAEPQREAVQFVGVVRQQVRPFEALPVPDRIVDVDAHARSTTRLRPPRWRAERAASAATL